jgi:murein DD-endopeptidase MepM/ murein hydrolase activator NlpD
VRKLLTNLFLLSLVLTVGVADVHAQKKGGWFRELFRVKTPKLEYVAPDTVQKSFPDTLLNAGGGGEELGLDNPELHGSDDEEVNLKKDLSIVVEEEVETAPEEMLVEVSEELRINKEWVSLHDYYSLWDSWNINPYEVDAGKFADTVSLQLFEAEALAGGWSPPLDETHITSSFGMRRFRWHYGTDVRLNTGDSVRTVFDGIVRIKKYDPSGYGYYLLVRHKNGLETLYGHLSNQLVEAGDEVKAGEVIGLGGSTGRSSGPHLHFEFRYQGNPINPEEIYDFGQNTISTDTLTISPETFSYVKEARKVYFHRVRRGDTLSGISRRYGVSMNKICKLNGIRKSSVLRVGQRLRIN